MTYYWLNPEQTVLPEIRFYSDVTGIKLYVQYINYLIQGG